MANLDFLVIGAQKCGTSALTVQLGEHPELHVPQHTARFFDTPRAENGFRRFMRATFADAPAGAKLGTVGPWYMIGDVEATSQRIHDAVPGARLIAILRDPLERAISQYRMGHRKGSLLGTFDEAVAEDHENGIVEKGLYGKALRPFHERFGDQLTVTTTVELLSDPEQTLSRLFEHIGVDPSFVPPSAREQIHKGGSRPRVSAEAARTLGRFVDEHVIDELPPARRQAVRREFGHFFERWNIIPDDRPVRMKPATRRMLIERFVADAPLLAEVWGRIPPWISDRGGELRWRATR